MEIASSPLGPPIDQVQVARLPALLRPLLGTTNGFFAFEQALLVLPSGTGDVTLESWNDAAGWIASYEGLADGITFFAMDIFGGQFGIQDKSIVTFDPETGERKPFASDLQAWARGILECYDYLTGYSLAHDWQVANGPLKPGWRLVPRQLFVLGGEFKVENLFAMPASEAMSYRGVIAAQVRELPDGATVALKFED